MKKSIGIVLVLVLAGLIIYKLSSKININPKYKVGQVIDRLDNVAVYYNGGVRHVASRHVVDGYNVGLKYQCVEFVKRYYLAWLAPKRWEVGS